MTIDVPETDGPETDGPEIDGNETRPRDAGASARAVHRASRSR
jgi:hypothetical protein